MSRGRKIFTCGLWAANFLYITTAVYLFFIYPAYPSTTTTGLLLTLAGLPLGFITWRFGPTPLPPSHQDGELTWEEVAKIFNPEEPGVVQRMNDDAKKKEEQR